MQTKEQKIEYQSIFSKRHVILLVAVLLYLANNLIIGSSFDTQDYIKCIVISVLLLIDVTMAYFYFFHKYGLLVALRFCEVACSCMFVGDYSTGGNITIVDTILILFYCMYVVETLFLFDLSDVGKRTLACFLCEIGFIVRIIVLGISTLMGSDSGVVDYMLLTIVSVIVCYGLACVYGNMENYYDSCIFAKNRLLDKARDNSDKIAESQKNMMLTNEQLGIKKFELEEAYKKINSVNADINLQNRFMQMMMSSFDLSGIVTEIRNAFYENMDISFAGLVFKADEARKKYPSGIKKVLNEEEFMEFEDFFLSYAFIHEHKDVGSIFIQDEISYEEFPFLESNGVKSIAAKTIEGEDEEHTSVYVLFSSKVYAFKDKRTLLDNVFGQMEVVLNNIALYYKVQDMSVRDALTELFNRRYLNVYFSQNFINKSVDHDVSLAMLDIDHFKNINDTYGHLFGDQAIRSVAAAIKQCAHLYDSKAFRYGGEEFVIIFDNYKADKVVDIMEELRNNIKNTDITNGNVTIRCNVSIGISSYPEITTDINTLVDRSDKAMYYSKQHGRDRITVDDGML